MEHPPDAPSGLPDQHEELEPPPLAEPDERRPDGEGETPRGVPAQPGIPDDGEPPVSG